MRRSSSLCGHTSLSCAVLWKYDRTYSLKFTFTQFIDVAFSILNFERCEIKNHVLTKIKDVRSALNNYGFSLNSRRLRIAGDQMTSEGGNILTNVNMTSEVESAIEADDKRLQPRELHQGMMTHGS